MIQYFKDGKTPVKNELYDDDTGYLYEVIKYVNGKENKSITYDKNGKILSEKSLIINKDSLDFNKNSIEEIKEIIKNDDGVKVSDDGKPYKQDTDVVIDKVSDSDGKPLYKMKVETKITLPKEISKMRGVTKWDSSYSVTAYTNIDIESRQNPKGNGIGYKIIKHNGNWKISDTSARLSNRFVNNGMGGTGFTNAGKGDYFSENRTAKPSGNSYSYSPKYGYYIFSEISQNVVNSRSEVTLKRGKSTWKLTVWHTVL